MNDKATDIELVLPFPQIMEYSTSEVGQLPNENENENKSRSTCFFQLSGSHNLMLDLIVVSYLLVMGLDIFNFISYRHWIETNLVGHCPFSQER